jgi:TRAP-type C4-dicarboxylate transport system permease small subunit
MATFLTYIFVKGPTWLRALAVLVAIGLFLFGCLFAASTFSHLPERPVPTHAHANRAS